MRSEEIDVRTGDRLVTDLTARAAQFCAGAGSETDLATALDHALPPDDRWVHRHGSPGHGRDHVMPAFVAPSLVVPVVDGRMTLGTWQSVVLVDPNLDNPRRRVRFSFVVG